MRSRSSVIVVAVMAFAMLSGGTAFAKGPPPPPPPSTLTPETSYSFVSTAGDYIGQGSSASYTPPGATFGLNGTASSLTVSVTTSSEWWYINLAAPAGQQLRPGTYLNAERAAFRTGRAPGLDVYGDGRGCNQVYGSFAIRQIRVDSTGKIVVLDATFTQNCETAAAPPLSGAVKVNAPPLAYSFTSDVGDAIGQGGSGSYTGDTTILGLNGTTSGVTFTASGMGDTWRAVLSPPKRKQLQTGTYSTVAIAPTNAAAGLNVTVDGRSCTSTTGDLVIKTIQTDASGNVVALDATFDQRCNGSTAALHGVIRKSADTALATAVPASPVGSTAPGFNQRTSLSTASAPGDAVGGGFSRSYDPTDATFTITGGAGSVTVAVSSGSDSWSARFDAPSGEQLSPGVYATVERAPIKTGRSAGLDVSENGRSCAQVYGSLTIDQILVSSGGSVLSLDASFVQRCGSPSAHALTGTVRYVAPPLSYAFTSDAGDYIGGGASKSYGGSTTIFGLSGNASRVTFSVSGLRDTWTANLSAPGGGALAAGTYTGAQRFPGAGVPGLDVSGDGRGCNQTTGSFTILDIRFDNAGNVVALSATFEQHCEGATAALRGTIRSYA